MGRYAYSTRLTVEQCRAISIKMLYKEGFFKTKARYGTMSWTSNGTNTGMVGFWVSMEKDDEHIRFTYVHTDTAGQVTKIDRRAALVSTPSYKGRRYWFSCPLLNGDGWSCNRRVGVLYLGDGKNFGCRHCYNLTYKSSQESHKYDRMNRQLGITAWQAKLLFNSKGEL